MADICVFPLQHLHYLSAEFQYKFNRQQKPANKFLK